MTFDETGTYTVELTVVVIAASSFLGGDIMRTTETQIEVLRPDPDGDGLDFEREMRIGTDPRDADTDGDGLDDGRELDMGTSPTNSDTDGDGLDDGEEVDRGTDPTQADSDKDGLSDLEEVDRGLNPTKADTDEDRIADGEKLNRGTDPTDADTNGDGVPDGEDPAPTDASIPTENPADDAEQNPSAQQVGGQEKGSLSGISERVGTSDDLIVIGAALVLAFAIVRLI